MSHIPLTQAPAVHRRRIGSTVVTALSDGYLDVSFDLLFGIDAGDARRMLAAAGQSSLPRMNINAYIVQDGVRTVLIDSGAGGLYGWGGRLLPALAAAGVDATDIDTVLLTHGHPDHIGGLAGPAAAPRFPNVRNVFIQERELAFWRDDTIASNAPDGFKPFFAMARNAFDAYSDRLRPFNGEAVLGGISAVNLPGHTAGHTGYLIESGGQSVLIWGDIVHFPAVQVARPDVTIAFDSDKNQAAKTRSAVLDRVASDKLLIGGMHLNQPSFVRVSSGKSGYELHHEPWSPALV